MVEIVEAGIHVKPERGLCIGKFLPPHLGHFHLFESASQGCQYLTIIVCEKPSDPIPGPVRAEWIQRSFPNVRVMVIDDRYDENDSKVWAVNTLRWMKGPPDVVFTSEAYGEPYAAHMGCRHVDVDRARAHVPVSGTAIRANPFQHWNFLPPPARAWFALRVCVVGAESTGTTTLARDLARVLHTIWVPEYGRTYSEIKMAGPDQEWTTSEFVLIANEQNRMEDAAAEHCNRVLICDTNSFATTLWHRRYMGFDSPLVGEIAAARKPHLYLLTGDEIPFVQDGLRDGEHIRHAMHGWFESALKSQDVPWLLLRGSREQRLQEANAAINIMFPAAATSPAGAAFHRRIF